MAFTFYIHLFIYQFERIVLILDLLLSYSPISLCGWTYLNHQNNCLGVRKCSLELPGTRSGQVLLTLNIRAKPGFGYE